MNLLVLAQKGRVVYDAFQNRIPEFEPDENGQPIAPPVSAPQSQYILKSILCGDLIEFEPKPQLPQDEATTLPMALDTNPRTSKKGNK